jgi:phosphatidylserine/phosphatidylglycerophosphate/cardiolipin synthase-like enzyme
MLALLAALTVALAAEPLQLILNNPQGRERPVDQCDRPICSTLLARINAAEHRIDFALYGVRDQNDIVNALKRAKDRGVEIRGVVDRDVSHKNYYSDTEKVIATLGNITDDYAVDSNAARARAKKPRSTYEPPCTRPKGFEGPLQCLGYDLGKTCLTAVHASREDLVFQGSIMHNKFFVIDDRYVWTGSTNLSDSGTGGYNANLVTLIDNPTIAAWYTEEFNQMHRDGRYHEQKISRGTKQVTLEPGVKVEVMFSPQDMPITTGVRPLLQRAVESIDVSIFFLTHKSITEDLILAHLRGVKVRVIMDATAAKNGYAKHNILRAVGIPVKIETWGGKMHAKSAVIDGQTVITGSMNWTSAGEGGNDENTIIVHSKTHAAQYTAWFEDLWGQLDDRWLTHDPDPESQQSGTACTDGSDNDFDSQRDGDDPGCSDDPPKMPPPSDWQIVPKEEGHGLVKGVIDRDGRRVYLMPNHRDYAYATVNLTAGEQWLCSEQQAKSLGFWRYKD